MRYFSGQYSDIGQRGIRQTNGFLQRHVSKDVDITFPKRGFWSPSLDTSILKMVSWYDETRETTLSGISLICVSSRVWKACVLCSCATAGTSNAFLLVAFSTMCPVLVHVDHIVWKLFVMDNKIRSILLVHSLPLHCLLTSCHPPNRIHQGEVISLLLGLERCILVIWLSSLL